MSKINNTIPHLVKYNSINYSNDTALREKKFGVWKTKSWKQCYDEIENITLGLLSLSIKNNQTIAILGNNTPRWVLSELAVQSLGSTALGLYSDALENEIIYLLKLSNCRTVFVEDEEQADKLMSLPRSTDIIDLIIYDEPKGMNKYNDTRLISYKKLLMRGEEYKNNNKNIFSERLNEINEDNICILCPTSGTSANPKLAMISHKSLLNHARSYLKADPKDSKDEYVSVLPLPWILGQVYDIAKWCLSRMKVNFVEETTTLFDDLREIGPTFILLAPRVWEQMAADIRSKIMDSSILKRLLYNTSMRLMSFENVFLKKTICEYLVNKWLRDQLGLSNVKSAATGGAALGPDTFKFFVDIGIPLRQLYGQTEQIGAYTIHNENEIDFDSVGYPFEGIEVKIEQADKEGIGEIIVKNPNSMSGYLNTEDTFLKNGWFHTGDAGYINKQKHLVVIDRMTDMSYTIDKIRYSPQYIENKLKFSSYIAEAAVIGSDKEYLSAIICVRYSVLSKWAEGKRIAFTTYSDLAAKKEIESLITEETIKVNETLPKKQRIKKFVLLYKEFDADDDELTRTKKLRRKFVIKKYEDIVQALYSNKDIIAINTSIKLQDGGTQKINTELKIINLENNNGA
ncbi:MAG: long-chain fatty acid--CoA ligase [Rickettsiales bacterium]|nr:long-chain fatty acid--CoA ligase [Rickettsiales bacterium]OUV81309.1 MAG: long-chain fatty acid--CoA ligase [Rickettsiales bacterium TMED131]